VSPSGTVDDEIELSASAGGSSHRRFSMDMITRILAEQAFTDDMVWSGVAGLFPILHQFKRELALLAQSSPTQSTVWFYVEETLMPKTDKLLVFTFRINATDRVRDVLAHVRRTLKIAMDADKCCLETQAGFRLRSSEIMATYGLGTLLTSWRLEFRERPKAHRADVLAMPPALPLPEKPTHLVEINFPPLVELNGMQKKVLKVDVTLPLRDIIEDVCARFSISDAARFCLCTTDLSPNVQLDDAVPLLVYGLGTKFTSKLVLKLNFKTVARGDESIVKDQMYSVYRFAQFGANAVIPSDEARAIILYLDAALSTSHIVLERERNKRAAVESRLRILEERVRRLSSARHSSSSIEVPSKGGLRSPSSHSPSESNSAEHLGPPPVLRSPPSVAVPVLPAAAAAAMATSPGHHDDRFMRRPSANTAAMQANLTRGIAARVSALSKAGTGNQVVFEPPPPLLPPPPLVGAGGGDDASASKKPSSATVSSSDSSRRHRRRHRRTESTGTTSGDSEGEDMDAAQRDVFEVEVVSDDDDIATGSAGGGGGGGRFDTASVGLLNAVLAGRNRGMHAK
jgi:hypothetical protein